MALASDPTVITGRFAPSPSAPDWFRWALTYPLTSNFVEVEACPIHYLRWAGPEDRQKRGLLFVHGGGARELVAFYRTVFYPGLYRRGARPLRHG